MEKSDSITWQKNQTFLSLLLAETFKTKSIHLGKTNFSRRHSDQKLGKHHGRITRILQKITPKYPEKWNPKNLLI